MNRHQLLLKYANLSGKGIEVAPYFNPAVPKRDGHNVLILDVFDTETLRRRALSDPNVPNDRINEIEEVDFVGDASQFGDLIEDLNLAGQFDYIVSSHNFEHLPDPIRFLQGCEKALAPGGVLSMAVPDCRACFDFFRMPSRLADWLAAYHEHRRSPSPEAIFDSVSLNAVYVKNGKEQTGCSLSRDNPSHFRVKGDPVAAYGLYKAARAGELDYTDTHCSVFFPESLELMLMDLGRLGLINLRILEVTPTNGLEFYVHMRKQVSPEAVPDDVFHTRRAALLWTISRNIGASVYDRRAPFRRLRKLMNSLRKRVARAMALLSAK